MEDLIKHHIGRDNLTGIRNCHMMGLHSIMLHDEPGNTVRIYVTTSDHHSNSNYIPTDEDMQGVSDSDSDAYRSARCADMSLGLHGHRTEIRLLPLYGHLYNVTADVVPSQGGMLRSYLYSSAIDGEGTIAPGAVNGHDRFRATNVQLKLIENGKSVVMPADKLHTVYTSNNPAWLVFERGDNVEAGQSHFYSYNLSAADSINPDMYQEMSSDECRALLVHVLACVIKEKAVADGRIANRAEAKRKEESVNSVLRALEQVTAASLVVPASSRQHQSVQNALLGTLYSRTNQLMARGITTAELTSYVNYLRDNRSALQRMANSMSLSMYAEWAIATRTALRRGEGRSASSSTTTFASPRPEWQV